jgi:hypothetical protein
MGDPDENIQLNCKPISRSSSTTSTTSTTSSITSEPLLTRLDRVCSLEQLFEMEKVKKEKANSVTVAKREVKNTDEFGYWLKECIPKTLFTQLW